jgi:uncharacterized OB-fold protein
MTHPLTNKAVSGFKAWDCKKCGHENKPGRDDCKQCGHEPTLGRHDIEEQKWIESHRPIE